VVKKGAPVADRIINVRIPIEWHEEIAVLVTHNGITASEFYRACIRAGLDGHQGQLQFTIEDGYKQARSLGVKLAHEMVSIAAAQMPESYEEAVARYGMTPHDSPTDWQDTRARYKAIKNNTP